MRPTRLDDVSRQTSRQPSYQRSPVSAPGAWRRLAAGTGVSAVLQIDGTVVQVALPSAGAALHVSSGALSWVLTAYFLTFAAGLVAGGRLVDRFGTVGPATVGLALFAVGAVIGALAGSFAVLVASRVLQGVGAACASPAALAGAMAGFPASRRGLALGVWGAASGLANLAGPLLGGVLTTAFDWRAAWWSLVPLALLAGVGVLATMRGGSPERVDEPPRPISRVTLVPVAGTGLVFCLLIGLVFVAAQYLQFGLGYSPLLAAAAPMVIALLIGATGPLAGRLADAVGERLPVALGFSVIALACAATALPPVPLRGWSLLPCGIGLGVGLGLLMAPLSRAALNSVSSALHGRVAAALTGARLVGAAIGAVLAGLALASGVGAAQARLALLGAAIACVLAGLPIAARLAGDQRA